MSHLFFVDESGQDQRDSPYEVLTAVSVEDRDLWNLITTLHAIEVEHFGRRFTEGKRELKGAKLLNVKTFRLAQQAPPIALPARTELARQALDAGHAVQGHQLTALAQAKLSFVREALITMARFHCRCFASIIDRDAPRPAANYLRKDYAYLFERIFYCLEDLGEGQFGIVVFDEIEKSSSHILLDQMQRYFRETATGRRRSSRIIPEPFFVHSDLTTGIQLADLSAYLICWGIRLGAMTRPARPELVEYGGLLLGLRHRSVREVGNNPAFQIWSFAIIDDLRARVEQMG